MAARAAASRGTFAGGARRGRTKVLAATALAASSVVSKSTKAARPSAFWISVTPLMVPNSRMAPRTAALSAEAARFAKNTDGEGSAAGCCSLLAVGAEASCTTTLLPSSSEPFSLSAAAAAVAVSKVTKQMPLNRPLGLCTISTAHSPQVSKSLRRPSSVSDCGQWPTNSRRPAFAASSVLAAFAGLSSQPSSPRFWLAALATFSPVPVVSAALRSRCFSFFVFLPGGGGPCGAGMLV